MAVQHDLVEAYCVGAQWALPTLCPPTCPTLLRQRSTHQHTNPTHRNPAQVGAQVLLLKNVDLEGGPNASRQLVNGSRGVVTSLVTREEVMKKLEADKKAMGGDDNGRLARLDPKVWEGMWGRVFTHPASTHMTCPPGAVGHGAGRARRYHTCTADAQQRVPALYLNRHIRDTGISRLSPRLVSAVDTLPGQGNDGT